MRTNIRFALAKYRQIIWSFYGNRYYFSSLQLLIGTDLERYKSYSDYKTVGSWAQVYVKDTLSAHVFNGTTSTTISPKYNLTFAEAAQAIRNLLVESKLINE